MLHSLKPLKLATELRAGLTIQRQTLELACDATPLPMAEYDATARFGALWGPWVAARQINAQGGDSQFMHNIAALRDYSNSDPSARQRILDAFDHDIVFDALVDPNFEFHYAARLNEEDRAVVRPAMEVFYDFLCSPGLPRADGNRLTRDVLIADFWDSNPELIVCAACDARRPDGVDGKIYADFDHFLPKSAYPFLSIHPANLLPTCVACNRSFKLTNDPLKELGGARLGETFLPYQRAAFGPLHLRARRVLSSLKADITETAGASSDRCSSLCRVFKLPARWSSRLNDIDRETDDEFDGWPQMVLRHGGIPDREKLREDLLARATAERSSFSRRESAILRSSYFDLLHSENIEFEALSARLGL